MYRSLPRMGVTSTLGGMRRLLKYKPPVHQYIRQAVETGVYRTDEEIEKVIKERQESFDDLEVIMKRFRQDIVRGTSVHDYPTEYIILQQHPPIPDPPRIPMKWRKKMMMRVPNPTEKLMAKYLDRLQDDDVFGESAPPATTEEYYRRLLGVPTPSIQSALGQKTAVVQKAYAAAIKTYHLQRTEGLSEEEALQKVDQILAEQDQVERTVSKERTQYVKERPTEIQKAMKLAVTADERQVKKRQAQPPKDAVFDTATLQGMMRWSERLTAVPYREWTIGASTALDHWIARRILGLSEETWQLLLEGVDPKLLPRGRDIVTVRETLFPETVLSIDDGDKEDELNEDYTEHDSMLEKDPGSNKEMTVDELLASIGILKQPSTGRVQPHDEWSWLDGEISLDVKVDRLTIQLQDWRRQHEKAPYDTWPKTEKERFDAWVREYVKVLVSEEQGRVDYDATREALLSQPPISREESDAFWNELGDERRAAVLLDVMREQGPPPGASILHAAFWTLPYNDQLERLLNIGALRPLLDEYTLESDRVKFLHRHSAALLEGVEMEHLVADPEGPVSAADLGPLAEQLEVQKDGRFRIEKLPYHATENISAQERTRLLYEAWNHHKAGRARYEEKLFRTGRLGLRYSDKIDEEEVDEDDPFL